MTARKAGKRQTPRTWVRWALIRKSDFVMMKEKRADLGDLAWRWKADELRIVRVRITELKPRNAR